MKIDSISVVIPIKEDNENLKALLNNLQLYNFTDVHVIDSLSFEPNRLLCIQYEVNYEVFDWNGEYPKKRNWYLEKTCLREWVLFLDSDERITEDFYTEIATLVTDGLDGFRIKYNNTFLGKKLQHGDIMTKIPLVRNHIRFEKIEEFGWSSFDMEIHEHPVIQPKKLGRVKSRLDHLERTNIDRYLTKHNSYSSWEARRLDLGIKDDDTMWRTKTKYKVLKSPIAGVMYFFYAFVIKRGFLDGNAGLVLAILKGQYFYWIYLKNKYDLS